MKKCTKCLITKNIHNFSKKSRDKHNSQCKECYKIYSRNHYLSNKKYYRQKAKDWSKEFKQEYTKFIHWLKQCPCVDCNKIFDPICMDFDHLFDKKFNIASQSYGISQEKLWEEILKCEIVCANCHRLRTRKRLEENN